MNLSMTKGKTFRANLTITDAGDPLDLTGCSLQMVFRKAIDSDALFVLSTSTSGITITNAEGGLVSIRVSPSNTASLSDEDLSGIYAIELTESGIDPDIYDIVTGDFIINLSAISN